MKRASETIKKNMDKKGHGVFIRLIKMTFEWMKPNTSNFVITMLSIALFSFSSCEKLNEEDPDLQPILLECNAFSSGAGGITLLENHRDGVDYIIDCIIPVNIDLTIEPGVTIVFTNGSGMVINESGSISAIGTTDGPILFTGEDKVKGSWNGIISYSNDVKNRFEFATIEYAGGGSFNSNGDLGSLILWADTYFRLENVTIAKGAAYGINCSYNDYNVEIINCTITECEMPFYGNARIASKISGGNFTGNKTDAIGLFGDAGSRTINTAHTWENLGVPYRISGVLVVFRGTLVIKPGVVIEFENGSGISVGSDDTSTLIAVGTSAAPITFTGVSKVAGAWRNIEFNFTRSPLNEISYATIEYAGNAGSEGAIYMWAKPVVKVTNVAFKNIGSCAIYDSSYEWDPNPYLVESDNTIENVGGSYMCIN
jgi:hypothetical protein